MSRLCALLELSPLDEHHYYFVIIILVIFIIVVVAVIDITVFNIIIILECIRF